MLSGFFNLFHKKPDVFVPVPVLHDVINVGANIDIYTGISWLEIDQLFTGMLININTITENPVSKSEKLTLEAIRKKYLSSNFSELHVPRLPSVIPKVMHALRDKNTDVTTLAKILSSDVSLVADVIRLANSAYFGRGITYDSLDQAIVNIGFNGIKQMVFSAAFKPILNNKSGYYSNYSSRYLWDKSVNAGLMNESAANTLRLERFHAYLAGLIAQSGMTLIIKELDTHFDGTESPSNMQFIDQLNRYALEVSISLSKQWQFPEQVTQALEEQVTFDKVRNMSKLGQITYYSDKLAKLKPILESENSKAQNFDMSKLMDEDMCRVFTKCQQRLNTL